MQGGPQAAHGGARGLHRQHHRGHVQGLPHDGAHRSGVRTCQIRSSNVFCNVGAARAGIDNLTKSLCVEWAGDGVRVFIGRNVAGLIGLMLPRSGLTPWRPAPASSRAQRRPTTARSSPPSSWPSPECPPSGLALHLRYKHCYGLSKFYTISPHCCSWRLYTLFH